MWTYQRQEPILTSHFHSIPSETDQWYHTLHPQHPGMGLLPDTYRVSSHEPSQNSLTFPWHFPDHFGVFPDHETYYQYFIMPPSHCREFWQRTNTNWHSLRIAQHRIDSNYFVLVRCHFRISSQANTNVLKCSKHSYWPCKSKPIRIAPYCIAKRRVNSCRFLLVRISLYIRIDLLYIRTGIRRLSACTL